MQMDIRFFKFSGADSKQTGFGADIAVGDLCTFSHHVAQLADQCQITLARHAGHFDKQYVATGGCYRQPGGNTRDIESFRGLSFEYLLFEIFTYCLWGDLMMDDLSTGNFNRNLAKNRPNLTFQSSHPGFAGVIPNDFVQGIRLEGYFSFCQTIGF